MLMKIMAMIGSLCIILFYMWAMFKAAGIRSRWEEEIEEEFGKNLYNKENKNMIINIQKLRSDAVIPKRGSNGAAGYDLYSCNRDVIQPHETKKFETGLSIEIPHGYFGGIFARSGLSIKEGLRPGNCTGVVDSDYRGNIVVALHNDSNIPKRVEKGDRIAQLVIIPYLETTFNEVNELNGTERGSGGFGSTGRK